jgi:hypothetical protein
METFIYIVLSFIVGWKLSAWVQTYITKQILQDLGVTDKQLLKAIADMEADKPGATAIDNRTTVELKIETHGGHLYAFELATDTFVSQAADPDSLVDTLFKRYPVNTRIVIQRENGGDLVEAALERAPK